MDGWEVRGGKDLGDGKIGKRGVWRLVVGDGL